MPSQPRASGASLIASGLGGFAATLPDVDRADVHLAVARQLPAETPALQLSVADQMLTTWDSTPWSEDLISRSCLVSTDGQRVLTYEQWRDERAAAIPADATPYRLYRSGVRDGAPAPGCIVIVEVQTDGSDTARQWVDSVFDALAAEATLHSGGIAGYFHISLDGTRVMNYAEWVDEASHIEAVSGTGSIGRGPAWQRVQTMPGVTNQGFRRYTLHGARQRSQLPSPDV